MEIDEWNNTSWDERYWNDSIDEIINKTEFNNYYFHSGLQFAILWFLLVAIVVGNSTVLIALLLNRHNKSRMNYFIMHLAIADLSVGLISVLPDIVLKTTIEWFAGNLACKLVKFMMGVVTFSSTYVLVALSIDRCDAIIHPMKFSGSWRRARGLISASWSLSALFCIPMLAVFNVENIQGKLQCWLEFTNVKLWQLWVTGFFITLYVIPALAIAACYITIVITIRAKSKQSLDDWKRKCRKKETNGAAEEFLSRRVSSRGLIPKAKIKTIKMTFVIVFAFVICWSPFMLFDILQVYGYIERTQNNIALATLMQSLAPLNSAANPIIYCIFSKRVFVSLRNLPPYKWILKLCGVATNGALAEPVPHHHHHTELLTSSERKSRRSTTLKKKEGSTERRINGKTVRVRLPSTNDS